MTPGGPVIALDRATKRFHSRRRGTVTAVNAVSLAVGEGESVGLLGSSGAGKSTIALLAAGLLVPDSGTVVRPVQDRAAVHLIFQDPYASLPPAMTVGRIVAEPLVLLRAGNRAEREVRALVALETVNLLPASTYAARHPHQLSGGERQRVALARALVVRPKLIIADEPTAMLDARARLALHRLMAGLRAEHGLAYLYITHDLALVDGFCDRVIVLDKGAVVEEGGTDAVLRRPSHPRTQRLVAAALVLQSALP